MIAWASWAFAAATILRFVCPDGRVTDVPVPECAAITTTTTSTTPPTTVASAYKTIYTAGFLGTYEAATITAWPAKVLVMKGEANAMGPLVAPARQRALAAGNIHAKFLFYLSLSDMDNRCQCYDQQFYDSFIGQHPEWILHDANGRTVATSNDDQTHRVLGVDIGNPAYIDAWVAWVMKAIDRYGYDGVMADNVIRCVDPPWSWSGWSAMPVNPRTHATYTCTDYRADMVRGLQRIRTAFDAKGKFLLGNHSGAWHGGTFADPKIRAQVNAMHGVEVEDCAYTYGPPGSPLVHSEQELLDQLAYMDYANQKGIYVECSGLNRGDVGQAPKRETLLAMALLTKEQYSAVSELNTVGAWWGGLDVDLGKPLGRYECLTSAGTVVQAPCLVPGNLYRRRYEKGVVVFNPTSAARTVPLDRVTVTCPSPVSVPPRTGRVCS